MSNVAERVEGAESKLKEFGDSAKEAASEQLTKLQEKGRKHAKEMAQEIEQRPISSFLIAMGIGLVLGYLLKPGGD